MEKKTPKDGRKMTTRSLPTFKKNPFMDDLVLRIRTKHLTVARGSSLIDTSTGEITGTTEVSQVVPVDGSQFVKLYVANIGAFFDLSRPGLKVFGALMHAVQARPGSDLVYMDFSDLPDDLAISKQTFYRGVQVLIENKFVARHVSPGWWYVNPNLFFNGDRVKFVREYRKLQKGETGDLFEQDESTLPPALPVPEVAFSDLPDEVKA